MHAEYEFSAGSYGSAKRDAVRMLQGTFPVRIVVEGATPDEVEPLVKLIDRQIALGTLGHLPVGGHKTRGAGFGRWQAKPWVNDDVTKARDWTPPKDTEEQPERGVQSKRAFIKRPDDTDAWVKISSGTIPSDLTLGECAKLAQSKLGEDLVAWWCDPTINLDLHTPPATFGNMWPSEDDNLKVDEVAFYAERAVWRAVRTSRGARFVHIQELATEVDGARKANVVHRPARVHGFSEGNRPRFSSAKTGVANVLLREWYVDDGILGFTITKEQY